MKATLEKRILIFAFLLLTLAIAVNTGLNIEGFRRDYRDGIILRCQSLASGLRMSVENVLGLGIPLADMEGINVRCQEIVRTDTEISYALIEDTMGTPLYASDPSFHLTNGIEFVSTVNRSTAILNFPGQGRYYDVSEPIHTADGRLAGRIRIGFPETVLDERTTKAFQRSVIILGVAFLIVFTLVVLFTKRDLIGPISRLSSIAREIAGGNFKVAVPSMTTRDFNELGAALQEMANSLQDREEKLQLGYRELEETNKELQDSYERQEKISAELGRSREMYRSLLEDASDAILVSDDEDRLVLINKAGESFFGISREQVEGRNLFSVLESLGSDDLESQYDMHQRVLRGESMEAEVHFLHPTDHRRVIGWVRGSPVLGRHGKRMVQSIIRDVTREREIKENLEKSTRELERLNQMKDSFLGVASHELKTPLTVIIGYSELILGEMSSKVDSTVLTMAQYIADAAERLSNIVRDMIDVSMLDSRRLRLRRRREDLNEVIRKAVNELEFFFSQRKQSLALDLGSALPALMCDPDRLTQVISNVVGNAIKFTPDGGTVSVSTRLIQTMRPPMATDPGTATQVRQIDSVLHPYLEIVIRDTGIGISEEDQIHVFEKFYEVGNIEEHFTGKVAFKGKGTGLGLTIVKGIIDMHGGEIWVESPGFDPKGCPGSEFHILLPLHPAVSDNAEAASNEEPLFP
jgi:PAS domain S-box-containing protein